MIGYQSYPYRVLRIWLDILNRANNTSFFFFFIKVAEMKGVKSLLLKRNLTEQEYKYSLSTNKMTSRFVTIFSLLGLYQAVQTCIYLRVCSLYIVLVAVSGISLGTLFYSRVNLFSFNSFCFTCTSLWIKATTWKCKRFTETLFRSRQCMNPLEQTFCSNM